MVENFSMNNSAESTEQLLQKCESAFPDTLSFWDKVYREIFPSANPALHSVNNVELHKNNNKPEQLELARELNVSSTDNFLARLKAGRICARELNERDESAWLAGNARTAVDKLAGTIAEGDVKELKLERIGAGIVNTAHVKPDELDPSNPLNNFYTSAAHRPDLPEKIIQPPFSKEQRALFNEIKQRPDLEAEIKTLPGQAPQHRALPDFWITVHKREQAPGALP